MQIREHCLGHGASRTVKECLGNGSRNVDKRADEANQLTESGQLDRQLFGITIELITKW